MNIPKFTHSPTDRHSGYFWFGAMVNKAVEKINNVGLSVTRT